MFGFLNVYKPKGMTSHDVVNSLRRITGVKQIGHTGTLDPFAEGVLPLGIGKATKLFEYLEDDKAYKGIIQLGQSTTTYDTEGEIVNVSDKTVSLNEIEFVLNQFRGIIEQKPPIYSAIKIKGKKLYEYARSGIEVEVQPRQVTVSKLNMLNYNPELKQLEVYVECSKGTYIRSLANDIGDKLGTYGHLTKLVRVKAGRFNIDDSVFLDKLTDEKVVNNYILNPLEYINYPKYNIDDKEYGLVSHGNSFSTDTSQNGIVILTKDGQIIAVGLAENNIIHPQKVFI